MNDHKMAETGEFLKSAWLISQELGK